MNTSIEKAEVADASGKRRSIYGLSRDWSCGDLDQHRAEVKFGRAILAKFSRPEGVHMVKIEIKSGQAEAARLLRRKPGMHFTRSGNELGRHAVWKVSSDRSANTGEA